MYLFLIRKLLVNTVTQIKHCSGSISAQIRIIGGLLDPDPDGQMRIRIQEVKSSEVKVKIAATYKSEKKRKLK